MSRVFYFVIILFFLNPGLADTQTPEASCTTPGWDSTSQTWQWKCGQESITGHYICSSDKPEYTGENRLEVVPTEDTSSTDLLWCWCKIDLPYETYWTGTKLQVPAFVCSKFLTGCVDYCKSNFDYEDHEGAWGSAESEFVAFRNALYKQVARPVQACQIGISQIKTSMGTTVSLYAEKYTSPAIAVSVNGAVCYANLELGRQSNAINVEYNGTIYHVVP